MFRWPSFVMIRVPQAFVPLRTTLQGRSLLGSNHCPCTVPGATKSP